MERNKHLGMIHVILR